MRPDDLADEEAKPDTRVSMDDMTLRDYFAAQALIGLLVLGGGDSMQRRVEWTYKYADEMLKARAK